MKPKACQSWVLRHRRADCWILHSDHAGLLVLDDATAELVRMFADGGYKTKIGCHQPGLEHAQIAELTSELKRAGFITEPQLPISVELGPRHSIPTLLRAAPWVLAVSGTAAFLTIAPKLTDGVPTGESLMPANMNRVLAISLTALAAMLTTALHEGAHMLYVRRPSLRIHPTRAVVTVDLTHTWAWRRSDQLAALSAGTAVDLALLGGTSFWAATGAPLARMVMAVLLARIVWQCRLYARTDGGLLLSAALDDPFLRADALAAARERHLKSARHLAWWLSAAASLVADGSLIVFWLVPFAKALIR